jgi:hypothetical protein
MKNKKNVFGLVVMKNISDILRDRRLPYYHSIDTGGVVAYHCRVSIQDSIRNLFGVSVFEFEFFNGNLGIVRDK